MVGPATKACDVVHAEKYRKPNETFVAAMSRVAESLKDSDEHGRAFRDILVEMRFLPAGRIQAAMGSEKNVTPYNCFVSSTIDDTFTDGNESIMDCAKMAARTMRQGGGIGYDFSSLRPKGDLIRGVMSKTDGPLAFMPIFDGICKATSSAGNRRGAQMGILRVDHPDIYDFIKAKRPSEEMQVLWDIYNSLDQGDPWKPKYFKALQNTLVLTGFNISVAITNEFMECLQTGKPFKLQFQGRTYREVDAEELWDLIMRSTYDWAEPGVIFIDTINELNNLWYCEKIAACNPCGEQPLPPYGACLLGSINLVKYLKANGNYSFNFDQLKADIPWIIRAVDNVIDKARYPLPQQEHEAKSKRRMGIGVTGLANCIEAMGYAYGSDGFLEVEKSLLEFINHSIYLASIQLAKEKGSFPLFDKDKYLKGKYIKKMPKEIRDLIGKYGIRNSHLTSIAPTGTISFCADNVSSGIEPVFSYHVDRKIKMQSGDEMVTVSDYGVKFLGVHGKQSHEVLPLEHVQVLTTAQQYVDSAVSKTCNVPADISYDSFKDLYLSAFELGAKGCTTYRPAGREAILKASTAQPEVENQLQLSLDIGGACYYDPLTGTRSCDQ